VKMKVQVQTDKSERNTERRVVAINNDLIPSIFTENPRKAIQQAPFSALTQQQSAATINAFRKIASNVRYSKLCVSWYTAPNTTIVSSLG